jgi:hypothetical protein
MGTKAEARFAFISDKAEFAREDLLDVLGRQPHRSSGLPAFSAVSRSI